MGYHFYNVGRLQHTVNVLECEELCNDWYTKWYDTLYGVNNGNGLLVKYVGHKC